MSVNVIVKPGANGTSLAGSRLGVVLALVAFMIAAVIPIKEASFVFAVLFLMVFWPLSLQQVGLVLAKLWPLLIMMAVAMIMTLVDVTDDMDSRAIFRLLFNYFRVPAFVLLGFAARRYIMDDRPILWAVVVIGAWLAGQTLYGYATGDDLSSLDHYELRRIVGGGDTTSIIIPLCAVTLWPRTSNSVLRFLLLVASGLAVGGVLAANSRTGMLVLAISAVLSLPRIPPLPIARWGSLAILMFTLVLTTPILLPILNVFGIDPLHLDSLSEVIARPRSDLLSINNEWRGFETYMAFSAANAHGVAPLILGQGLSAQAPLGIFVELGEGQFFDRIDVFHNGWSFIILHSGVLGIFLYIFQFFLLCAPAHKARTMVLRRDNKIFASTILVLAATTSSVAGMFNTGTFSSVQLFMLGCFYPFSLTRFPERLARRLVPARRASSFLPAH